MSTWNELIAAYDRDYDDIEAARAEYVDATHRLLDSLNHAAEGALRRNGAPNGWARRHVTVGGANDAGGVTPRDFLLVELQAGASYAGVNAWIGRPWHGPERTLRIGLWCHAAAGRPVERQSMLARDGSEEVLPSQLPGAPLDPDVDTDEFVEDEGDGSVWLRIASVDLSDPGVAGKASAVLGDYVEASHRVLAHLVARPPRRRT
ncbi:hypothetical protein L6R50_14175 [Myxococcota bacterium]|nr:hypothetical protein [Myxococcota bacterium]